MVADPEECDMVFITFSLKIKNILKIFVCIENQERSSTTKS